MLKAWRRAGLAALVTGAAVAAQLAGVGLAHASTAPAISIAATTKLKPVTGDTFVVYHLSSYNSAQLHGTVSNGASGEVAALYAQSFPFKTPAVRVASITLKGATAAYSFTVTPSVATHYNVRLFATATATSPVVSSSVVDLYVANDQSVSAPQKCARPVCHETFTIDTYVPASALSTEMRKYAYSYFGINLGSTSVPPAPAWLTRGAANGKITGSRRISAGEFENTMTFSFTIGTHSFNWLPGFCTKDEVTVDGIGLPGSHGCGASRISSSQAYVG
jgi:hypothetical protein